MNKKINSLLISLSLLFGQVAVCKDNHILAKVDASQGQASQQLSDGQKAKFSILAMINNARQEKRERELLGKAAQDLLKEQGENFSQEEKEALQDLTKKNTKQKKSGFSKWYKKITNGTVKAFSQYKTVVQPVSFLMSCYQDVRNAYFLYSLAAVACSVVGKWLSKGEDADKVGQAIGHTAYQILQIKPGMSEQPA